MSMETPGFGLGAKSWTGTIQFFLLKYVICPPGSNLRKLQARVRGSVMHDMDLFIYLFWPETDHYLPP